MKTFVRLPTIVLMFFLASASSLNAEIVEYDLTIGYTAVNYTGREVRAMTINGSIPALFCDSKKAISPVYACIIRWMKKRPYTGMECWCQIDRTEYHI